MRRLAFVALGLLTVAVLHAQGGITVFDGARILDGNGGAPIESGRIVVQDGRISAIGSQASLPLPRGVTRVDVSGKTIMPAMINVHAHMGYEGYTSWGASNHTAANLLDHQREVGERIAHPGIQAQRVRRAGDEMGGGFRIGAREERDVVPQPDQLLGEVGHDAFRSAIELRRNALGERSDLGNLHG